VGYDPCGYACEMLRSCYTTQVRFYEGQNTTNLISWYFVPPGTPWLPYTSVINSLNYVPASERVDSNNAGEQAGVPRPYSKGNRNVAFRHVGICGGVSDYAGSGTRPTELPPVSLGVPQCCNPDVLPLVYPGHRVLGTIVSSGHTAPSFYVAQISSQTPFELLANNPWFPGGASPAQIDLYNAIPNPSGTMDYLTDFTLLTYPGYASVPFIETTINPPSDGSLGEGFVQPAFFQCTGDPAGSISQANGYVVSDNSGMVLWYQPLSGYVFSYNGDYLNFSIEFDIGCDYN